MKHLQIYLKSNPVSQPSKEEETLAIWWLEELREGELKFVCYLDHI
jgi:hypothetical protein